MAFHNVSACLSSLLYEAVIPAPLRPHELSFSCPVMSMLLPYTSFFRQEQSWEVAVAAQVFWSWSAYAWIWPGQGLAVAGIWEMNQRMDGLFLLSFSGILYHSCFLCLSSGRKQANIFQVFFVPTCIMGSSLAIPMTVTSVTSIHFLPLELLHARQDQMLCHQTPTSTS